MNKIQKNENGFSAVELIMVLVILALVGTVGWLVYKNHHKAVKSVVISTPATHLSGSNTDTTAKAAVSDTWTGDGASSDWSDSSNWSNGVPQNGYDLIFNASSNPTPNNDLNNLSIGTITLTGGTNTGDESIFITGNPVSLSGGITDNTGEAVSSEIKLDIRLTANQTFNGSFGTWDVSLGSHSLNLEGATVNSLSGSGKLIVNSTSAASSDTEVINQASPDFSGPTQVDAGMLALNGSDGLGTSSITVDNGATLRFVDSVNSSDTFSNPITISGDGENGGGGDNGAINLVAPLSELTLTGKVTLAGDTKLGIYNYDNTNTGPGSFIFTKSVAANGYNLSGLASSIDIKYQ